MMLWSRSIYFRMCQKLESRGIRELGYITYLSRQFSSSILLIAGGGGKCLCSALTVYSGLLPSHVTRIFVLDRSGKRMCATSQWDLRLPDELHPEDVVKDFVGTVRGGN